MTGIIKVLDDFYPDPDLVEPLTLARGQHIQRRAEHPLFAQFIGTEEEPAQETKARIECPHRPSDGQAEVTPGEAGTSSAVKLQRLQPRRDTREDVVTPWLAKEASL
jgi:hypothetical protein